MAGRETELRFPFINLEKALLRAEEMFKADPQGRPMAVSTVFEVWDYTIKSSGGHQTIGALKLYGLLDDTGVGNERRLFLTDAAKRYFKDERDEERQKLLKVFALSPPLIARLWSHWGASPPADNIARSYLKVDIGLNEQSARALLGIYKDNIVFAGLKGSDKAPEAPAEQPEDDKMADADTLVKPAADQQDSGKQQQTGQQLDAGKVKPPPAGSAPKVSLDGDHLTIAASIPMSELPALLKKIKALEAFYKA